MNECGRVISVNVGRKSILIDGRRRPFATAIKKRPVSGRAELFEERLAGDDQADRDAHGGPDRALYAYAREDYLWWEAELGRPLAHGLFGENVTLADIDVNGAAIGERWRIGDAIVRVTSARVPCFKLAHVVGDPTFVKRFADALRPGAYLAVERLADIGPGDAVEILTRPERTLSIADFARIYFYERERVHEFLEIPEMTDQWRAWACARLAER